MVCVVEYGSLCFVFVCLVCVVRLSLFVDGCWLAVVDIPCALFVVVCCWLCGVCWLECCFLRVVCCVLLIVG